jgi:hypothetical protein
LSVVSDQLSVVSRQWSVGQQAIKPASQKGQGEFVALQGDGACHPAGIDKEKLCRTLRRQNEEFLVPLQKSSIAGRQKNSETPPEAVQKVR